MVAVSNKLSVSRCRGRSEQLSVSRCHGRSEQLSVSRCRVVETSCEFIVAVTKRR